MPKLTPRFQTKTKLKKLKISISGFPISEVRAIFSKIEKITFLLIKSLTATKMARRIPKKNDFLSINLLFKKMKIVFMGTSDFACPTLEKLIKERDFEIVAVYTREPQIAGRGHKITNSPIHNLALKHQLKIITPKTLRNPQSQKEFFDLKAEASIVVAFGLILPEEILRAPKFGCINLHPSLLPNWRGAAPIQRTIMAGDKETAISIIQMDSGIDSGDVLYQTKIPLTGQETYAELSQKLARDGAEVLIDVLKKLPTGKLLPVKQNGDLATYAKKIEKSECAIDWKNSAEEIERKIRALNGGLAAFFTHNGEKIKIFASEILNYKSSENEAGKILDDRFSIQCGKGIIRPLILQREGKKPMPIEEFLRGLR